jgi:hypothetical protein
MRSSVNGHLTRFYVRRLTRWGCWSGDLLDLTDIKADAEDYWGPGAQVVGHQIMIRGSDGSWRMVGTYTQAADRRDVWTMQIHGYPGEPTPYEIVPGRQIDTDTRTEYYALFTRGAIVSGCLHGGPDAAPAWGQHVYWRSRFSFSRRRLRANYEENGGCGPVPCQVESWTFARGRAGIARIADLWSGGRFLGLVLTATAAARRAP